MQADNIANDCIAKMRQADGIILASPTYFADITPELKALIDRAGLVSMANDRFLKRKRGRRGRRPQADRAAVELDAPPATPATSAPPAPETPVAAAEIG